MNLENHGEMFLKPSARMDIPSSHGRLPQHDAGRMEWNQYTTPPQKSEGSHKVDLSLETATLRQCTKY